MLAPILAVLGTALILLTPLLLPPPRKAPADRRR